MIVASASFDERLPQVPERTVLIQEAFRLEWLTVAWMVIEALVAIGSGVIAGSLTLTAFGLDSVIELVSAGVLISGDVCLTDVVNESAGPRPG
jgi:hypothetical protein